MQINDLFQTVAKTGKPLPMATDEYEFVIDRAARRVVNPINIFANRETVRVRTNTPFTWNGSVDLPDTSLGALRTIRCRIEVSGTLPPSETKAREFLGLLLREGYDFERLFSRALDRAITDQRVALNGAFVEALRARADLVHMSIATTMRAAGLPVDRIELRPLSYDTRAACELVDETDGITIRTRGSLEANRITYKARLVWGPEPQHVVARLAYNGKVEGRTPGPALERPLVPGQIQPLEAYFRQLLTAALGHESYQSIVAGDASMLDRVKAQISDPMSRGTGRVVDTLVIYPVMTNQPSSAEKSLQFRNRYVIMGIRGNQLEIEHAIRFALVDRDRWLSQHSPDPEAFLRQQVVEAAKVFLHDKRFEDIVGLYLGPDGEAKLGNAVASRVAPIAATIGYRLVSVAAILAIPEHDFIEGCEIELPESNYQLADPHLQPLMRLKVTVKVIDGGVFARALARQEDFQTQIRAAIEQTLRTALRGRSALDYYGSPYVNGIALPQTGDASTWRSAAPNSDNFTDALRASLSDMLVNRFGLDVIYLGLEPGADPIIDRMQGLANLPVHYSQTFEFPRGDHSTHIQMSANATIFITGLAADHWPSFYRGVPRYESTADHVDQIRGMLTQTLQMLEHPLRQSDRSGLQSRALHAQVIKRFTARLCEEYGLEARLRPLALSVYRPRSDHTLPLIVAELHEELRLLLAQRRDLRDTTSIDADYERERLSKRITLVRAEIETEAKQREAEINETETVEVEQDLLTGRLEPPPDRNAADRFGGPAA